MDDEEFKSLGLQIINGFEKELENEKASPSFEENKDEQVIERKRHYLRKRRPARKGRRHLDVEDALEEENKINKILENTKMVANTNDMTISLGTGNYPNNINVKDAIKADLKKWAEENGYSIEIKENL